MNEIVLSGTAFEIGKQHGEHFAERIRADAGTFWEQQSGGGFSVAIGTAAGYLERRYPEILDEIRGIARGAGIPFEQAFLFNDRSLLSAGRDSCSHLAIVRGGRTAVGFNKDSRAAPTAFFAAVVKPEKGHAWAGYKHVGRVWGYGMNDSGLCAAGTSADPVSYEAAVPSLGLYFLGPLALGRCGSAAEAVRLALETDAVSETGNVLFADELDAAVVEFGGAQRVVRRAAGGVIVSTNFFASGQIPHGSNEAYLKETTARYERILTLAPRADATVEGITGILAHHCRPGSICRHSASGDRTVLSYAAVPSERRLLISFGPPCESRQIELRAER